MDSEQKRDVHELQPGLEKLESHGGDEQKKRGEHHCLLQLLWTCPRHTDTPTGRKASGWYWGVLHWAAAKAMFGTPGAGLSTHMDWSTRTVSGSLPKHHLLRANISMKDTCTPILAEAQCGWKAPQCLAPNQKTTSELFFSLPKDG